MERPVAQGGATLHFVDDRYETLHAIAEQAPDLLQRCALGWPTRPCSCCMLMRVHACRAAARGRVCCPPARQGAGRSRGGASLPPRPTLPLRPGFP